MLNKKSIFLIILILTVLSISTVQAADINEIDDISTNDSDSNMILSESNTPTNINKAPLKANSIVIPTYIYVTNNNTDFKTNQSNSLNISLIDINKDGLAGREIIIVINDSIISKKTTDEYGNAYLNLDNLPNGEYSITYTYRGDSEYTSSTNTTVISISDYVEATVPTFLRATSLTYKRGTYGNFIITLTDINGTILPNQKVLVKFNGEESEWYTNYLGQVSILCTGLNLGSYDISFSYAGKDQYLPSNGSSIITVIDENAILTTITAEDLNMTVTDMENFIITLKDEDGNPLAYKEVMVDFNGETAPWYTGFDGEIRILLLDLDMGIYPISYTFEGEGDYAPAKGSNIITVINPNATNTTITGRNLSISVGDVENFIISLKTDKGTPIANQTVTIDFLTNLTKVTDENGEVSITLYELTSGIYNISYTYAGKGDYLPSNGTNTIYVSEYVPGALNTTITGSNIRMNINETRDFTITLRDSNGRALPNQYVYFDFLNATLRQTTNSSGQAKITFSDLENGTYTVRYSFNGTLRYIRSSGSNTITVVNSTVPPEPEPEPPTPDANKTTTQFFSSDMIVYAGDNISFIAILTDARGVLLSGKTVTFTYNNVQTNITTDLSGQAVLRINNVLNGTHNVTFIFNGDNNYTNSSGHNVITALVRPVENNTLATVIQSENFIKSYGSSNDFTGTLLDANGNPVAGQHINIKLTRLSNGANKTYDVVSNYLGVFTLPINLAPGSYIAEIEYGGMKMGNTTYQGTSKTNTVTVVENRTQTILTATRFDEPYNANMSFTGTLKDINNNSLAGHTVTVELTRLSSGASKTYNTVVNYLGDYSLDINLAVGEYSAHCSYAGTSIYLASTASNTVTVY